MAMVALYRPGPMAMIPDYIARKNDPTKIKYFDPRMEKWLKKSYGLLVYQDDCLYTAIELAGYSWVDVDKFRKAIGKKIPEEMAAQKEKFIEGCIKNGFTKSKAEEIFGYIEPFTSYGFNKAHAASYGMLAYYTAYMKANYPVEYMCAFLTSKADVTEDVANGIEECRKTGIIIGPPDINQSLSGFEIEPNPNSKDGLAIRFGLDAIKNVGDAAIENIIHERHQGGPFASLTEFCLRVDGQKVNKRVLESLIKVGAMDQFGERNALLSALDRIRLDCEKINTNRNSGQFGLFDTSKDPKSKPIIPPDKLPDVAPMNSKEKLNLEKELIGIYVTENPISKILEPFQQLTLPKISDLLTKPPDISVKTAAVISRFKVIHTKRDNAKMAFVTLEDETAKIEAVVFPKTFEKTESIISPNKAVYIEGKLNLQDNTLSILVDILSESPPKNSSSYDFVIQIPAKTSQSQLMTLNKLFKDNPNGHRGLIILANGKNIPLNYGVNYSPKLRKQIDTILKIA
jgi:DNA polymerase-3 subunit alpha